MTRSNMFPRARSRGLRWGTWASVVGVTLLQPVLPISAQQTKVQQHGGSVHGGEAAATDLPQLVDITAKTGIHFTHLSSPNKKNIVGGMRGGGGRGDYVCVRWLDI